MLILASASPRRKELLSKLVPSFKVEAANIDEKVLDGLPAHELPLEESRLKAYDVYSRHPEDEILSADTVVILEGEILGKPKDEEEAFRMLMKQSGKTQTVLTGYTYIGKGKEISRSIASKVTFRKLSEEEAWDYIRKARPLDKAGAYGIQDEGTPVESLEGSFDNVMGLPTEDLRKHVFRN